MTYLNVSIYNQVLLITLSKGGEILMHFMHHLKDMDVKMENKGEELVITVKGDKEKIAVTERKLKALKELCCCCGDNCDC